MGFLSVLSMAHQWLASRICSGDTVIDATAGNGNDTLFLAERVGPAGTVYAFDIQQQALDNTARRLTRALGDNAAQRLAQASEEAAADSSAPGLPSVNLLLQSHDRMQQFIPAETHGKVAAVMFNLGYLPDPSADSAIITMAESTIPALEAAFGLLRPGGALTAVVYPGHPGGDGEAAAVEQWAAALPQSDGQTVIYRHLQKKQAPYLIGVEKRK
ncbi:methyltransferase domain-containing protein [Paenibacillaceae bacterium]|nr:methyltransferase domain-containing protein [Paenibacillaceae bacterium]